MRLKCILPYFLLFTTVTFAQKSISEIANLKEKKWKKLVKSYSDNTIVKSLISVNLLQPGKAPNPKKIGVLTFQLWDESITSSRKIANTTYYEKHFLTSNGSNSISNKLISVLLPEIQSVFRSKGIQIVEPSAYLDNPEKKELYETSPSKIELSKVLKLAHNSFLSRMQGIRKGQGSMSANGYAFYPLTPSVLYTDVKAPASVGKLSEKLGLDAVLTISVRVSISNGGKSLMFRGLELGLVGPIDDEKEKEYKGVIGAKAMNRYRDGVAYATAYFSTDNIKIASLKKKSGKVTEWFLDDVDKLAQRMGRVLLEGLENFTNIK